MGGSSYVRRAISYRLQEGDSGKCYVVGEDRYTPEEMNEPSLAHLGLICLHYAQLFGFPGFA